MQTETAVFGAGCFWCTEAVFKMLRGVISVTPGYAGGTKETASYEQVSQGTTKQVEVAQVVYDSTLVPYRTLLTIFFASHDGTQINRQGNDIGPQYRSVVFYTTPDQKTEAEAFIQELNASTSEGAPLATTVEPLEAFFPAEDYHKGYYEKNASRGYCQVIIAPKLQKVQKEFAKLLKH